MIVTDLTGAHEADTLQELEILLAVRHEGGNEFWIASEAGGFPLLAVNVLGHNAVVHFFPDEGHPGYQSVGSARNGTTTFPGGTGDKVEVPATAVIPFDAALRAAKEFAGSFGLPSSIQWLEL